MQAERPHFYSEPSYPRHCNVFRFCKSKCHKNLNTQNLLRSGGLSESSSEELTVDSPFETHRVKPGKCYRESHRRKLLAQWRVEEIEQQCHAEFTPNRLKKRRKPQKFRVSKLNL